MNPGNVDQAIAQLVAARREHRQFAACRVDDIDEAYAIQSGVAHELGWPDGAALHWKSGAADAASLQTHAPLPPAGVFRSPADLRHMPFTLRGIEIEIALRLGTEVDTEMAATLDESSAAGLVDALCVSVEIIDTRWTEGLQAPPFAKLADLQAHGGLVLGDWFPWHDRDWSIQVCDVRIGQADRRTFRGTHPLGRPTAVLPNWLRHATQRAGLVAAGTVVTTGSWCGVLQAPFGAMVDARFAGIGEVTLQF